MRVQVKSFMSSPVLTAVASNTVAEIRSKMQDKGIHAIPIVDMVSELPNQEVLIKGIVTATDLNSNLTEETKVEDLMSSVVHVIHQDSSAKSAAKMMLKHNVHHLVVMHEGKITGMISAIDFVKLVEEHGVD